MNALKNTLNGLCSIPLIGGFIALLIAILPALVVFALGLSKEIEIIAFGLVIAVWCFFLDKTQIIKLAMPVLPLPFWVLGLLISASGVYQLIIK